MVLVKRQEKPKTGYNIAVLMQKKDVKGEVGLEIEVEGNRFEKENVPPPWRYCHDGSLRGRDNAEYVLRSPVMFKDVEKSLDILWRMFAETKSVLDESNRTSVHVHINVQPFHLNRLTSFMALYYVLEEILTQWCGEHRVGNLFCLRAKDAPAIITQVREFIRTDGRAQLGSNHHYAALNTNALSKFGSLEFRTLRGVSDPKIILDWVEIIERLYTLSANFEDPRGVCDIFSADGPIAFFEAVLGDKTRTVRQGVSWSDELIRESLYAGVRLAQDICYCRDWSLFKPMDLKPDPFGRDAKKVVKSLSGVTLNSPSAILQQAMDQYSDADLYVPGQTAVTPEPTPAQIQSFFTVPSPAYQYEPEPPQQAPEPDWLDATMDWGEDE